MIRDKAGESGYSEAREGGRDPKARCQAHTQIAEDGLVPRTAGRDAALLAPDLGLVMVTDF